MYKSIQACRGLAALQVMLYHLGAGIAGPQYLQVDEFWQAFRFGNSGVEFFFVLSGFIISFVHRRDVGAGPAACLAFIQKRALRVYPVYWIILAGVAVLCLLTGVQRALPHDVASTLETVLLIPRDRVAVGGTGAQVLIVAWTLQYEMVFYACFALVILSRAAAIGIAAAFIWVFVHCSGGSCSFPQAFFANELILLFVMGAALAWIPKGSLSMQAARVILAIGLIGFLLLAASDVIGDPLPKAWRSLAYGSCFSIWILGLLRAEDRGWVFGRSAWLQYLGAASYSLYLLHFPLINALCKVAVALGLNGYPGATCVFVTATAVILVVTFAFHERIEKPLVGYLSHLRFARTQWPIPS
jgi:exopolysaccharide production protein ExoZ